ncbi:putative iron-hydroxamate transporter subunit; ATP-binding component of ABC superfamily fhuC [Shewanella benthica]|uniref:Putative iron-hydroxamate transporter subunit ATP-binding component of ABC superfamily fhuC n=1 Tax=Shewanella benthica TaxID=43661 RepID=A0A330LZC9_9GAMM|nr:ABC transporter ATP-binding protein [Shewanella benthica]SQH75342.1 putative iron-hydroxamate transporter subunit; ATP-binding component of ABC superfamily fhuC [Shewanella benthica]
MSLVSDSRSQSTPELALDVRDLSWQVESRSILSQVSFSIRRGEMLGIIGPNGAGKSTLLRCIYRYIKPDSGQIQLFGQEITHLSSKAFAREVAVVLQDTPHHFELTTAQLVAIGLTPHKGPFEFTNSADRVLISDALEKVGLTHKAKQSYEHLSGGEKQRALIARAIVQQPKLLILDEPTNHLDIRYQIQIMELLHSIGITVITSIHDLNLASAMCDKLLLLEEGKCIRYGSPKEVLTEQAIGEVFGVCSHVTPHPQHGNPQICYYYGYEMGYETGYGTGYKQAYERGHDKGQVNKSGPVSLEDTGHD